MAAMNQTGNTRVGALRVGTPTKSSAKKGGKASGAATLVAVKTDQMDADMLALNLKDTDTLVMDTEEAPKMRLAREKLLEEAKRAVSGRGSNKLSLSIVIIGIYDQLNLRM
jgi:elongation factor 1 alpha-like protein